MTSSHLDFGSLGEEAEWEREIFEAVQQLEHPPYISEDFMPTFEVTVEENSAQPPPKKRKLWCHAELMLLHAITLMYFGKFHSMTETRGTMRKRNLVSKSWETIHKEYDRLRQMKIFSSTSLPYRSPYALYRKWKDSGSKSKETSFLKKPESISYLMTFLCKFHSNMN